MLYQKKNFFQDGGSSNGNFKALTYRGGTRNFPTGVTLQTRGLKHGFQGFINAKDLRKIHFSPSDGD